MSDPRRSGDKQEWQGWQEWASRDSHSMLAGVLFVVGALALMVVLIGALSKQGFWIAAETLAASAALLSIVLWRNDMKTGASSDVLARHRRAALALSLLTVVGAIRLVAQIY